MCTAGKEKEKGKKEAKGGKGGKGKKGKGKKKSEDSLPKILPVRMQITTT